MNWKRYKLLLIAGSISLLLSIALLVWFLQGRSRAADLHSEIQQLGNQRTNLTTQRPFPSQESYAGQTKLRGELEQRRDAIRSTMLAGQINPPDMNRSRFGDYVRSTVVPPLQALAKASTLGGEHGVILTDPTFGLQNYIDGELPEPGDIPALMARLELMRHVAGLLFTAGISELQAIERERPADPRAGGRPPGAPAAPMFATPAGAPAAGPGVPRPGAPVEEVSPAERLKRQRAEMFEEVTFTLRFRVYEDKFWNVLNAFAADPNQIVIRKLDITNGNESLHPPYLRRSGSGAQPGRPAATAPGRRPTSEMDRRFAMLEALGGGPGMPGEAPVAAAVLPGLANRRERLTGGEFLEVVMDIVFYRLKPVQGS